jgi:serine/threonine protein kinase
VYLVKRGDSHYAMKTMRKNVVLEGQNVGYVKSERDILILCHSNPFLIQLFVAFQDAQRLYFLMEIARAGSLYNVLDLQAPKPFKQERIIFYTGQVTCALMFLHSKRVVRILIFFLFLFLFYFE